MQDNSVFLTRLPITFGRSFQQMVVFFTTPTNAPLSVLKSWENNGFIAIEGVEDTIVLSPQFHYGSSKCDDSAHRRHQKIIAMVYKAMQVSSRRIARKFAEFKHCRFTHVLFGNMLHMFELGAVRPVLNNIVGTASSSFIDMNNSACNSFIELADVLQDHMTS